MGRLIYLLDTNVLSEPAKLQANPSVLTKFQQQNGLYCTSATVWQELRFGCERLPVSKLRQRLESYLAMLLANSLTILPFDTQSAEWLAVERARLMKIGLTPAYADAEIAAVAAVNNLILVTRNTEDFRHFTSLTIENWFNA
jgi:tRNA(fMet)-specific endonuclease VapC